MRHTLPQEHHYPHRQCVHGLTEWNERALFFLFGSSPIDNIGPLTTCVKWATKNGMRGALGGRSGLLPQAPPLRQPAIQRPHRPLAPIRGLASEKRSVTAPQLTRLASSLCKGAGSHSAGSDKVALSIRLRSNQHAASPTQEHRVVPVGICLGIGRNASENSFEPVQNALLITLATITRHAGLVFPSLTDKVWVDHHCCSITFNHFETSRCNSPLTDRTVTWASMRFCPNTRATGMRRYPSRKVGVSGLDQVYQR